MNTLGTFSPDSFDYVRICVCVCLCVYVSLVGNVQYTCPVVRGRIFVPSFRELIIFVFKNNQMWEFLLSIDSSTSVTIGLFDMPP